MRPIENLQRLGPDVLTTAVFFISPTDGTELDPREKALTALALRSLANHFILNKNGKKEINLSYRPNPADGKPEDPKQRLLRCRSTKIKPPVLRRLSASSTASSTKSKASTILEQIPVCETNRCLMKYGCCHSIV